MTFATYNCVWCEVGVNMTYDTYISVWFEVGNMCMSYYTCIHLDVL